MERLGFVGAGRAGTALARGLAAAGWPVVAVSSRRPERAARLAALLPGARPLPTAQAVADAADLVFLTVPDAAIAPVAASIAWRAGQAVVHTSGVESLAPLAAARAAGARVGSLHPLQTFAAEPAAEPLAPFAGIVCALEGDAALLPRLEAMAVALGARPLVLPAEAKPLYHAAAVLASNYLVALLHQAAALWSAFGVPERAAIAALLPLVRATVENVAAVGPAEALTGPIARGDTPTVAQHLAALARAYPEALPTYRALGAATLALAQERLEPAAVAALAALLRPEASSPSRGEPSTTDTPNAGGVATTVH
jgi:predicted short-subunit dehydrogenase-like oxidoreductase (DUF2520 family)